MEKTLTINQLVSKAQDALSAKNHEFACALAQQIAQLRPRDAHVIKIAGWIYLKAGRHRTAVSYFEKALELSPSHVDAIHGKAVALSRLGPARAAEVCFSAALKQAPENRALIRDYVSHLTHVSQRFALAATLMTELYEKDPKNLDYIETLGFLLERSNQLQELENLLGRVSAAHIESPNITLLTAKLAFRRSDFEQADSALRSLPESELRLESRAVASELRAKIAEHKSRYTEAYNHYLAANRHNFSSYMRHATGVGDFNLYAEEIHARLSDPSFNWSELAAARSSVSEGSDPIFLIGFPRSGTTMLESIFRTDDALTILEERNTILDMKNSVTGEPFLQNDVTFSPSLVRDSRAAYWEAVHSYLESEHTGPIIDKMPLWIAQMPIIATIFPSAKFVVALRTPADAILSAFQQNFRLNTAMLSLTSIGRAIHLYDKVFGIYDMVNTRLSPEVLEVRYEDIVQDWDNQIVRIFGFLGRRVPEGVKNFHQRARSRDVRTTSYAQVSEPLNSRSIGKWKNYRDIFEPYSGILDKWCHRFGYDACSSNN